MRAYFILAGAAAITTACATTPQTTINVDGRDYVASFVESRDPVTNDLIEIRYTITEFGIECGSRAECAPLIREAEATRAAAGRGGRTARGVKRYQAARRSRIV